MCTSYPILFLLYQIAKHPLSSSSSSLCHSVKNACYKFGGETSYVSGCFEQASKYEITSTCSEGKNSPDVGPNLGGLSPAQTPPN